MNTDFYAFGEILWDCLPSGRHAGGAPFNVTAHLVQLGSTAGLISAVGSDALGDEILQIAASKGVETRFVARAELATGTVQVTLDANANATYDIVQPVAWDEIPVPADALAAVAKARALVFGSLAARSPRNREQLERLLALDGPLKCFDVNLRPPFVDPAGILALACRADLLKLNDDEVGSLAAYVKTGALASDTPRTEAAIAAACATLAEATGVPRICVTRGGNGASLWVTGNLISAPAPQVVVRDTVGAGDSFLAGLLVGLTRHADPYSVLKSACRLGAYVASQNGATPSLPPEIVGEFAEF